MVDWAAGRYERTAEDLEPVAADVVARARIQPGERVLDVACGTGNAALLAARAGAAVTGVDLARRLVEAARQRATAERLDVDFHVGDAQALPFGDGSFDVALSVFGIIFASDPKRAFSEVVRVLRPGGRALITAWTPDGAIAAMSGDFARAVAEATNTPPSERFAWHEPDAIARPGRQPRSRGSLPPGWPGDLHGGLRRGLPAPLRGRPSRQPGAAARSSSGREPTTRFAPQALAVLTAANESSDRFAVTSTLPRARPEPLSSGSRPESGPSRDLSKRFLKSRAPGYMRAGTDTGVGTGGSRVRRIAKERVCPGERVGAVSSERWSRLQRWCLRRVRWPPSPRASVSTRAPGPRPEPARTWGWT